MAIASRHAGRDRTRLTGRLDLARPGQDAGVSAPVPDRTLHDLLRATTVLAMHGPAPERRVSLVSQDSRAVAADACFVAVPGFHVDGHRFVEQAAAGGARSFVVQADRRALWAPLLQHPDLTVVEAPDTRAALADLAAAYHGYPARALAVIGVTGTDGKSTTCALISAILEAAGHRTGIIGGVEFKVGARRRINDLTQSSPEAPLVQSLLAEMVAAGVSHAVIESTSHGLALHRLDHCEYDIALFTGLSDDHLDFHRTREAYLAAKLRLFAALDTARDKGVPKRAVVNADDPAAAAMRAATRAPAIRVGLAAPGLDVTAEGVETGVDGTAFRLITDAGAAVVRLPLPGEFNVRNALLAAGAARALSVPLEAIVGGLERFRGVPGRMERIDAGQPFAVVVDAAATTDAFRTLLQSIRPHVAGRLIVVFGCAGERDPGRRRGMGQAAAEFADVAVLTSENPRSEEPAAIVREIAAAMEAAGRRSPRDFMEEPDRRAAIARAIALAAAGDYVLIAGKGAEQTIISGDRVAPWDDRREARELLATRLA